MPLGRTFLVRDFHNTDDHDEMVRILRLVADEGHPWPPQIFGETDCVCLVLEELPQKMVYGVVAAWLGEDSDVIALCWVHPMLRGRKFGSTLLGLIEGQCQGNRITAECPSGNTGGRAFLFKAGYHQVSDNQYERQRRAA